MIGRVGIKSHIFGDLSDITEPDFSSSYAQNACNYARRQERAFSSYSQAKKARDQNQHEQREATDNQ
jgi:hypothetical protein